MRAPTPRACAACGAEQSRSRRRELRRSAEFEGYSSDELVKALVSGNQARAAGGPARTLTPLSQRRQEPRGCDITEAAMELGAEVRAARTRVCTRERCSERASDANKHCLFRAAARV